MVPGIVRPFLFIVKQSAERRFVFQNACAYTNSPSPIRIAQCYVLTIKGLPLQREILLGAPVAQLLFLRPRNDSASR